MPGQKAQKPSGSYKPLIIALAVIVLLECLVFNFPFWESLTFADARKPVVTAGSGLRSIGDAGYELTADGSQGNYLQLSDLPAVVHNLHIVLANPEPDLDGKPQMDTPYQLTLTLLSGADSTSFTAYPTAVVQSVSDLSYIRIHPTFAVDSIRVHIASAAPTLQVIDIETNVVRPFSPNPLRVITLLALFALVMLFRPKSPIYQRQFTLAQPRQRLAIGAVVVALIAASFWLTQISAQAMYFAEGAQFNQVFAHHMDGDQYNKLADAFLQGRLDLDLPVSPILTDLDNPYSFDARFAANSELRDLIYWDHAYFDGRYYSYFGALPALLAYLPVKALLGIDARTDIVAFVFAALCCIAFATVLYQLARVYFKKLRLGYFLLALVVLYCGAALPELLILPRIYVVPILASIMFAALGLTCWLHAKASCQDSACQDSGGRLPRLWLVLGALCFGATLGCRPHFVLVALLAIPLFLPQIKAKLFFARGGWLNTACVVVPIVICALPVMWYNAARFGSVFDFGASYNLTGNDMTKHSFVLAHTPLGIFAYLFQPFTVVLHFPFIDSVHIGATDYQGFTSSEPFLSGYLPQVPVALFAVGAFVRSLRFPANGLRVLALSLLALALVLLIVDVQLSGVVMRYFADFGWLIALAAVIVIWQAAATLPSRTQRYLLLALCILTALTVLASFWSLLAPARYDPLAQQAPFFYYSLKSWFTAFV